ncbi:ECF transporter S component [Tepidibacter hydrothermalis]|uniref:ECF transporter S component n=1 Tax=Tepidibacter hydrothermalis TaxID=3036126 RepID=A0ABY8EIA1_9FIRM|nr:ECF transporter S component [Tepidibacter hydrothermalis]WFD11564.1 ECF transporter S component [Tepidibacter hydrothermalis]
MKNTKLSNLVLMGLMTSMVCIGTMLIQIPVPATNGFINIGDSIIFITSALFGPVAGMVAGGIGSALADLLSGYAHWALFTLIIKGLEGLVVGILVKKYKNKFILSASMIIGSVVMVVGYYIGGGILKGSFIVSLESIPWNVVQGVSSTIIGVLVSSAIMKTNYMKVNKVLKN